MDILDEIKQKLLENNTHFNSIVSLIDRFRKEREEVIKKKNSAQTELDFLNKSINQIRIEQNKLVFDSKQIVEQNKKDCAQKEKEAQEYLSESKRKLEETEKKLKDVDALKLNVELKFQSASDLEKEYKAKIAKINELTNSLR